MPHLQCNVATCGDDGWDFRASRAGTACTASNGGAGKCDGGNGDPDGMGQCVATQTGQIKPKFYVLSVVYAPPGTKGSGSRSSVTYSTGSTAGTSTKVSSSFKGSVSETAEASIVGFASLDVSGGYTSTTGTDDSLEIKKSTSLSITDNGPGADGINHDADLLYIWLNPLVDIVGNGSTLKWTMSSDGSTMDVQYVSVGQLKNPSTIPAGVLQRFAAYGITSSDYATMLARDPFANGSTAIDTNRFAKTWTTLPYEPPLADGESPAQSTLTIGNETTTSHTFTISEDYTVGYTIKVGPPSFASWLTGSIETTASFTWTNSSEHTSSTTSSQSASVTITGPSFGYGGPTDLAVYYDTLYGTFMFAPITGTLSLSGVVTSTFGAPLANAEVLVKTNAGTMRTFTGPRGEYRVHGAAAGNATVSVGGVSSNVVLGSTPVRHDFAVAPKLDPR